MTKYNQKIAHIERIIMSGCTCKTCDVNGPKRNYKEYPSLDCNINCKKNGKVEQECSCSGSFKCPGGKNVFHSDHFLSLEKLKTSQEGDPKSENIIKNCIDVGDEVEHISILFRDTVKDDTLIANLFVTNSGINPSNPNSLHNINFPIDIFQNKTDIQIGTGEINKNPANMTNNDLQSQYYDYETENFCEQIGGDFFEDGNVTTALIGSLFFLSALSIGLGFLYEKYRKKTKKTNPEDSNNVI
ncbi:hypothetical protein M153_2140006945 [Pseudoloma neurophilia]|uniref:Uncharacterized protein n=1 Tax=Pseudoloma neurophilia TaxID=146866 RepID=A0A0R0M544_9MICR|nr:hypothetical protein M153_2140006945 [Pseudoloma neurophilia]